MYFIYFLHHARPNSHTWPLLKFTHFLKITQIMGMRLWSLQRKEALCACWNGCWPLIPVTGDEWSLVNTRVWCGQAIKREDEKVDVMVSSCLWALEKSARDHQELPDVQAGFRKGRGTRDQIANIHWIVEKARESKEVNTKCFKF